MIITLGGHHGAWKSTLWKKLGEKLGYRQYSTWWFMRDMAMERGISLIDLWREAESDGWIIDHILDDRQKNLGKEEDNFIIDGRLAFYFIPHAVKIFLQVESHEAAKRIFHDESRSDVESHFNIEEAAKNIEIRRDSENERYMKYYGVHIYDMDLYDIVVDTTGRSTNEVFNEVIQKMQKL
jgi:cytidylate kinase